MKISDCKANVSYISIPMVLDVKANLWVGKGGIPHLPGCTYNSEALTLIVTNECGDEFGETTDGQKKNSEWPNSRKLKGKGIKGFEA